jgi:cystathionine gamma-lyase
MKEMKFETKVIHVGGEPDPTTGAIMPPIFQTSTYVQSSPGEHKGYEYSRSHNPTRTRLQECLASTENAKHCFVTASGLSASTLIMHMLPKGSKILCGDDVYGGTYRLFSKVFPEIHQYKFVDTTNLKNLEKEINEFKPALIWLETPTNPLLKISDVRAISDLAKKVGALTVVDNTFMSPFFQNPLDQGADIVLHSMTKFINGHSDVVGGALMFNSDEIRDKIFFYQNAIGPSQSPFDSWLVLRGLKTLAYPGLKSHPQHELAKKQMKGFGGMITFFLKGGIAESRRFLENLKIFALAESLGGVESLVDHPAIMTHASIPKEVREQLGIYDNLIRLSVGIEDSDDLIKDLELAFSKV